MQVGVSDRGLWDGACAGFSDKDLDEDNNVVSQQLGAERLISEEAERKNGGAGAGIEGRWGDGRQTVCPSRPCLG